MDAKIDSNSRATLTAVSSVDGTTIVPLYADPTTHRLLVDSAAGSGTVTSVSVVSANGLAGTVATATTTPAITLTLGAITPSTVNGLTFASQATGFTIAGGTTSKTLTVPLDASVSGTNTGDQDLTGYALLANANTWTGTQTFNAGTDMLAGQAYKYNGANVITASTALYNYFFGGSGNLTMTGAYNIAQGYHSLNSNTTGSSNTAQGLNSLYSNTTGYNNSAQGYGSLFSNTTGYQNSALGMYAGHYITGGSTANQTSNNSLYLGYNAMAYADGDTNEIVIGASATGNGSNSVTLGNGSITKTILQGNVGVGTTSPTAVLTLKAGTATANTAPLKFTAGTNLTVPEAGAVEFDGTHLYETISSTRYQIIAENDLGTNVKTALGVAVGSAGAVVVNGGALGTPSSGTLTNCTGLPVAGITSSTSTAIGVGSIELGAATDTTLSRSAAGVLAVEGVVIPSISSTNTLTNKRVTKRVGTVTQSATPTWNTDNYDIFQITGLAQAITSMTTNLSGTPSEGEMVEVQITDNGTARAITWGASFANGGIIALPTTTVISTMLRVLLQRTGSVWSCVGVA